MSRAGWRSASRARALDELRDDLDADGTQPRADAQRGRKDSISPAIDSQCAHLPFPAPPLSSCFSASNYTNQPYPLAWAPHHLGYWPIADLPYTRQENMPLEETAWNLLVIAAIAQRQGGDLTWLAPYWPVMETWFSFMSGLMPFPQEQLSTDDFDGPLYNASNLAIKGVAAVAAYGYIVQQYTGDSARAAAIYAQAAGYGSVMVDYAWNPNATDPSQAHFMIGYKDSQSDGGVPTSWPMLYNALWLRIFGYTDLLPNQSYYLDTMRDWYSANVMNEFGVPLNSRKTYCIPSDSWRMETELAAPGVRAPALALAAHPINPHLLLFRTQCIFPATRRMIVRQRALRARARARLTHPHSLASSAGMTFLAATFYTTESPPRPSDFSAQLHTKLFNWANETTGRDPFSDWINTESASAVGFEARPVMGALWAPMLVAEGPQLGLGHGAEAANAAFRAEHARIAAEKAAASQ